MTEQGGALAGLREKVEDPLVSMAKMIETLRAMNIRAANRLEAAEAELAAAEARLALVDGCVAEVARTAVHLEKFKRFVRAWDALNVESAMRDPVALVAMLGELNAARQAITDEVMA